MNTPIMNIAPTERAKDHDTVPNELYIETSEEFERVEKLLKGIRYEISDLGLES